MNYTVPLQLDPWYISSTSLIIMWLFKKHHLPIQLVSREKGHCAFEIQHANPHTYRYYPHPAHIYTHTHTLIRNCTRACGSAIVMLRHPREPCHRASRFQGCMDGAPSLDMKAPESVRHMFKTLHINANSLRYEIIPTVLALWPPKIKALKNASTLCP